jgi:hypothetical protein
MQYTTDSMVYSEQENDKVIKYLALYEKKTPKGLYTTKHFRCRS